MPAQPQIVQRAILVLNCIPRNVGTVVAEHVHYFVKLPGNIVAAGQEFDIAEVKDGFRRIDADALRRPSVEFMA